VCFIIGFTLAVVKGKLWLMKATRRSLLTTEEFAAALGLSPKTVRQWTWKRRVSFVRVGRAIRFQPETVTEIIDRGSVPARVAR
jgi:excisionase family DNA binding protein